MRLVRLGSEILSTVQVPTRSSSTSKASSSVSKQKSQLPPRQKKKGMVRELNAGYDDDDKLVDPDYKAAGSSDSDEFPSRKRTRLATSGKKARSRRIEDSPVREDSDRSRSRLRRPTTLNVTPAPAVPAEDVEMVDLDDSPIQTAQTSSSSAPTPGVAACSRSPALTPEKMIFRQLLRQPHLLPVIRATRDLLRLVEIGKSTPRRLHRSRSQ